MRKAGLLLATMLVFGFAQANQADSTGLEGDNLDLNGVLDLFKESESVEEFEKKLNTESNGVNNLDLNSDGEVDYIRVVDHADSNAHSLALQVPVSEDESQDVAVIAMEQADEETINLQVIGDSELYGEDYMVEPKDQNDEKVIVNVYAWRPVRYIYGPRYRVWRSPWRWRTYPRWYRPWRRVAWGTYWPRVRRYHRPYYRRVRVRRCHYAHKVYHVHHVHSPWFYKKHHVKHKNKTVANKPNNKPANVNQAKPASKPAGVNNGNQSAPVNKNGNNASGKKSGQNTAPTTKSNGAAKTKNQPKTTKQVDPKKKGGAKKKKSAAGQKSRSKKSVTPTKRPGATKKSGNRSSGGGSSRGGKSRGGKR